MDDDAVRIERAGVFFAFAFWLQFARFCGAQRGCHTLVRTQHKPLALASAASHSHALPFQSHRHSAPPLPPRLRLHAHPINCNICTARCTFNSNTVLFTRLSVGFIAPSRESVLRGAMPFVAPPALHYNLKASPNCARVMCVCVCVCVCGFQLFSLQSTAPCWELCCVAQTWSVCTRFTHHLSSTTT